MAGRSEVTNVIPVARSHVQIIQAKKSVDDSIYHITEKLR